MSLTAAFVLSSLIAAPVPKADPLQQAKQSFQGEWKVVELIREGRPEEKEEIAKTSFFVKGNEMKITSRGRDELVRFTLDLEAKPTAIDLKPQTDDEKKIVLKGIYKLEKDKLTICFSLAGQERPTEFKSIAGSKTVMLVLERVKK